MLLVHADAVAARLRSVEQEPAPLPWRSHKTAVRRLRNRDTVPETPHSTGPPTDSEGIPARWLFAVNQVGRRDGWTCQRCRQPVNSEGLRSVDPLLVASLDHKDEEGPNTRENVQLTHLWCNNFRDHVRWTEWAGVELTAPDYRAVLAWRAARPGQKFPKHSWREVPHRSQ